MRKNWLLSTVAGLAAFIVQAGPVQAQAPAALTGQVSSTEEGNMEGVVVSAKKEGSPITISVVSDAQGRFSFPADRLEPGKYTLKARAVGYDLPNTTADVAAGKSATAQLKLTKTRNLAAQLTNAEWLLSMPGTEEQKKFLLGCNGCHTYQRIVNSSYDAQGFLQVFQRMSSYYPGSTPLKPQRLAGNATRDNNRGGANALRVAEWLTSVNLSQTETRQWPLKTLPRLKGKSTQVVITEYDLPNNLIQPHDVILDQQGTVWYSDFGQQFLGKMDAKTGKVTQYPIPVLKTGWSEGTLDLEADKDGNIWVGVMYQANIAKFDPKTEKFQQWPVPKEWQTDAAQTGHLAVNATHVDGKVWIKNSDETDIYRLDVATGKFENLGNQTDPFTGRRIGTYGIHADSQNNAYLLDFSANNLVRIDAKTKALKFYKTPTEMSRPRRGRVDSQDRLWFAEYGGNAIGMLDPKTGEIKEWKVPTPWSAPYDALVDKHGDAWTGSMLTDRVARLDTKTGQYTEYPLPRSTNIRRVFVDDRTNPGTLWVGNNHGASIVKVEPLN
jgi:streptogramin lyase